VKKSEEEEMNINHWSVLKKSKNERIKRKCFGELLKEISQTEHWSSHQDNIIY